MIQLTSCDFVKWNSELINYQLSTCRDAGVPDVRIMIIALQTIQLKIAKSC